MKITAKICCARSDTPALIEYLSSINASFLRIQNHSFVKQRNRTTKVDKGSHETNSLTCPSFSTLKFLFLRLIHGSLTRHVIASVVNGGST